MVRYDENDIRIHIYKENGKIYIFYSCKENVKAKYLFYIKFKMNRYNTIEVPQDVNYNVDNSKD